MPRPSPGTPPYSQRSSGSRSPFFPAPSVHPAAAEGRPAMKPLDSFVLFAYIVAVVGLGCWFAKRSGTTKEFMAAGGRLPG
jgi:hypothetical protein